MATGRKRAIFQMLGRGHSIEEITHRLGLAPQTVEDYRRRAKDKLGCASTDELRQFALLWTRAQNPETA